MDERKLTPLCELARKYGTDKGGWHLIAGDTCHNYTPTYDLLLGEVREQVKWVLEIGINYGCSLRMWREYFPNAQIVGFDCDQKTLVDEDRICSFAGDQYNQADLLWMIDELRDPKFDLIVDDGSHNPTHQIFSAQVLLPHLSHRGIYVIEDLYPDCQPQLVGNPITQGMPTREWVWHPVYTGHGIGKAHCGCGCGAGENLLVIHHV